MRNFARFGLAVLVAAICSSLAQAQSGGVQATVVQHHVFQQPTVSQMRIPASSSGCGCQCSRSAVNVTMYQPATPVRTVARSAWQSTAGSIAQRSAEYRAANGIKGHAMHIEGGHMVGVGWASNNPRPATCYNNMGGDYAVVRGRDGYYATRVIR